MSKSSSSALSRRGMLVGAGVAGAAAVAVSVIPLAARPPAPATALEAAPEPGGGYRLSAHVMRYYQTARI